MSSPIFLTDFSQDFFKHTEPQQLRGAVKNRGDNQVGTGNRYPVDV